MLIARAFPVINVYTNSKDGQRAHKGHVITLPQSVQQLADVLPRCPKDLPVIIFTVNGKDNQSKDFHVRKQKVSDALHWLVENNPLYKNITIDYAQLNALPENSRLDLVTKINFEADATKSNEINCKPDSDSEEEQIGIDRGPIDSKLDQDLVFDENTEMSSFLPLQDDIQKEKDLIAEKIKTCTSKKYPWQIVDYPFNEFRTEYLATMSFPTLFS